MAAQTKTTRFLLAAVFSCLIASLTACNNPFDMREPEQPGAGGVAIKPSNTPENVLYNLESSFESLSIQDYLYVFSDDFTFHPDPEDSLQYEQEFPGGWNLERETVFANYFLIAQNFVEIEGNPIEVNASYEYKPGPGIYEYHYQMFVPLRDAAGVTQTKEIEGYAFLSFVEDAQGNWSIRGWEDHRLVSSSYTWGWLRAKFI